MMPRKNLQTLLAAGLAALTMTAVGQTTGPMNNDTRRTVQQSDTAQDRLPASKAEASSATHNSSDTTSGNTGANDPEQVSPDQSTNAQDGKSGAKHPPTAVMDRAVPTQNAQHERDIRKHPPTSVMNNATPEEKSPDTSASESSGSLRPGDMK